MDPKLLREIDRLFDELVHDPWRSVRHRAPAVRARPQDTSVLLEIPLQGKQVESIVLTTEGDRLTVTLSTMDAQALAVGGETRRATEQYRQTFELPAGTVPLGFEARFEAGVLHLRVPLCRRHD